MFITEAAPLTALGEFKWMDYPAIPGAETCLELWNSAANVIKVISFRFLLAPPVLGQQLELDWRIYVLPLQRYRLNLQFLLLKANQKVLLPAPFLYRYCTIYFQVNYYHSSF